MLGSNKIAGGLGVAVENNPDVKQMFPDAREKGIETFKRTGVYRLIHMMLIKDSVLEQNPALLQATWDAFKESKERWLAERGKIEPWEDPLPMGMDQTRKSLEALMQHSVDQHILPKAIDLDSIFPGNFK
jgi:4,5-dihydroxyphthalate decarboxylase